MPPLSKNLFSLKFGFRFQNSKNNHFMEIIEGHGETWLFINYPSSPNGIEANSP